jgi:8-oxo-dGTP pyrophosphatase MutT (NUDIX family)
VRLVDRLRIALADAHARDLNIDRQDFRITEDQYHAPAAVLIAITDRPEPGVILTQRAAHMSKHAGQVALPGGRIDPQDTDAIAAALREAEEEIALPRHLAEIIGTTDPFRTFTGYDITPVLAVIPPDTDFIPNRDEVESVFEVPLSFVMSPKNHSLQTVDFEGKERSYHEMWWDDYRIWGVTARIFVNLTQRLAGMETGL